VFSPHGRVIEELSENDIVMNQLFVEDTETRHYLPNVLTHFRSEKWTFIRFKESNWWSMMPKHVMVWPVYSRSFDQSNGGLPATQSTCC
jgi:hypothetical protein